MINNKNMTSQLEWLESFCRSKSVLRGECCHELLKVFLPLAVGSRDAATRRLRTAAAKQVFDGAKIILKTIYAFLDHQTKTQLLLFVTWNREAGY